MHSFFPLLGLLAVIPTIVSGKPVQSGKELRRLDRGIHKRQEVDGEDIETSGATDQLRKAVNYASVFSAQKTVTYSAVSTGAAPSDATLVGTVTRSPGSNAAGSPPDAKEQGKQFVVDHIVELQFVVGAFSIQSRPTTGATSIPLANWNSASNACFTTIKNYAPPTAVASALSNVKNLHGIPNRFNGFKQQVFTGRLKNQTNNPSDRTYPSDFGKALQKFLNDNQQGAYDVINDVGKALAGSNVGNYGAIRDYFTAYAQSEYQGAITFLSTWVGTSYTAAPTSSASPTSSTETTLGAVITPSTKTALDTVITAPTETTLSTVIIPSTETALDTVITIPTETAFASVITSPTETALDSVITAPTETALDTVITAAAAITGVFTTIGEPDLRLR